MSLNGLAPLVDTKFLTPCRSPPEVVFVLLPRQDPVVFDWATKKRSTASERSRHFFSASYVDADQPVKDALKGMQAVLEGIAH